MKTSKDWREVKIGSFAQLSKEPWNIGEEELPYIGLEHIDENKLRLNSIGSSSTVASNKHRFSAGDTLFGKLRPYFRKVVKLNFDGICSTDIWVVQPKEGVTKDFIFYFFANQKLIDLSYSSSGGTRMPRADWDFLAQTTWWLPPLPEQKAIAEVLSSLDDKIDLLHRQNKTLEDMAQTLFRQWFVEQADEKWERVKLRDYADHKKVNIKPYNNPKTSYTHYSIPAFDNGKKPVINFGKDIKSSKYKVFSKSILVSKLNPRFPRIWAIFGNVGNAAICSTEFQVAFPSNSNTFGFLYCFLQSKDVTDKLTGSASGTSGSHQRVRPEDIFNLSTIKPDENVLTKFSQITDNYWKTIFNNQSQIYTLENLRDAMLPKLMNGEVNIGKQRA